MQNSLEKDLDFNLDNFNKKFDETVDSEDYKSLFPSYFFDSNILLIIHLKTLKMISNKNLF